MKTVVVGSKQLACDIFLELLNQGHEVAAVFTRDNEEGMKTWHRLGHGNLAGLAKEHGVQVLEGVGVNTEKAMAILQDLQLDVIFSCFWAEIFKEPVLNIPRLGVFNLHTAYLPYNRGSRPIPWALIEGQEYSGITLHKMMTGVDNGPIVAQTKVEIERADTAQTLYEKVTLAGKDLFKETLPLFTAGTYNLKLQTEEIASYHPRGEPYGGQINPFWANEMKERFRKAFHFPPFKGHKEAPPSLDGTRPKVYLALGVLLEKPNDGNLNENRTSKKDYASCLSFLKEMVSSGFRPTFFFDHPDVLDEYRELHGEVDFAPRVEADLLKYPLKTAVRFAPQLTALTDPKKPIKEKEPGIFISGAISKLHWYKTLDRLAASNVGYMCRYSSGISIEKASERTTIIGLQPFRHENGLLEFPVVRIGRKEALPLLQELIVRARGLKDEIGNDIFIGILVGAINVSLQEEIIEMIGKLKGELEKDGGSPVNFGSICKHYNRS